MLKLPDFSFIAYFVEVLEFLVVRIIPAGAVSDVWGDITVTAFLCGCLLFFGPKLG